MIVSLGKKGPRLSYETATHAHSWHLSQHGDHWRHRYPAMLGMWSLVLAASLVAEQSGHFGEIPRIRINY